MHLGNVHFGNVLNAFVNACFYVQKPISVSAIEQNNPPNEYNIFMGAIKLIYVNTRQLCTCFGVKKKNKMQLFPLN